MPKTILGFTYSTEEFDLFCACGEDREDRMKRMSYLDALKSESFYGGAPIYYRDGHTQAGYMPITEEMKIDNEYVDIWWNLSEPVSKEWYFEVIIEPWDTGDIVEEILEHDYNVDTNNTSEKKYDKLWSKVYDEVKEDEYKRYLKLWHESKQAYYKYIDKIYQAGYKQLMESQNH